MGLRTLLDNGLIEGGDLPWSERTPQAIGLFAIAVAMFIAYQLHEFSRPDFGLILLFATIAPWVMDMVGRPRSIIRDLRFRKPLLVVWTVVVLVGVYWLSVYAREEYDFAPFFLVMIIGEMASTAGPRFGALVWVGSVGVLFALTVVNHFSGMAIWAFACTIGWLGGTAYRTQVKVAYELAEAQSQLSKQAVDDERHRLAREIHDLIAHSLAVTMLQLTGARMALKAGDTQEALEALEDAELAGRSALAEIHRTVGLLSSPDAAGTSSVTPTASDLPRLVESFRDAGLIVQFDLEGDLSEVPMATGLASYRMVQESLSNAVKHAPGAPVRLRVEVSDQAVTINVVNAMVNSGRVGAPSGIGLRGMAERASLLGGTLVAEGQDGSWRVSASLPSEQVSA